MKYKDTQKFILVGFFSIFYPVNLDHLNNNNNYYYYFNNNNSNNIFF